MPSVSAVPLAERWASNRSNSAVRQRTTCSTGPKTSSLNSSARSSSRIAGATKLPPGGSGPSQRKRRSPCMSAIQRSSLALACGSITGSSCRHSSRKAEQRWPAERKADAITSSQTCSGNAVASTIMALMPPVSAIKAAIGPSLAASARWMSRATSVDPVKATPATLAWPVSRPPTLPSPGTRCSASAGTPAKCSSFTASKAISGVCSAGLATTLLPAASAAVTWPVKITAPAIAQFVALAGRTGKRLRH